MRNHRHTPGEKIGAFRLERRLGGGGFGEVWLALHEGHLMQDRRVALKLLRGEVDEETLRNEVALWIRANGHENIVPFLQANCFAGVPVIVSEYRPDGSLEQWLQFHGGAAPTIDQAVELTRGILCGLERLHDDRVGIVHRDLKPANVLLHESRPQIADFGIARLIASGDFSDLVQGTRPYMAPEAFAGSAEPAVDLWAVGVMLFQMLSGRRPFPDEDAICDPESPLPALPPGVPAWVEDAVARALDKDPERRFPSARAFRDALEPGAARFSTARKAEVLDTYRSFLRRYCERIYLQNPAERDAVLPGIPIKLDHLYIPVRLYEDGPPERSEENPAGGPEEPSLFAPRKPTPGSGRARPAFVGEWLGHCKRLVALGRPGSGKSTLVKRVADIYLSPREQASTDHEEELASFPAGDWLPVLVRCRDYNPAENQVILDDLLKRTWRQSGMTAEDVEVLAEAVRERLAAGQAILLVDGLDEITDPRLRRRFCEHLTEVEGVSDGRSPVLVTSRVASYREMGYRLGPDFRHFRIAELTRQDKHDFARRWCERTEPPERRARATEDLRRAIDSNDRIGRLAGNPLLLTTLALVKRHLDRLPRSRADVYRDAVDVLLKWRHEVDEPLEDREALPQLQYLAYAMCRRGVKQLPEDDVLELLEQLRREYRELRKVKEHSPEDFLRRLVRRTEMLDRAEVAQDGERVCVYAFNHPAFQEYLAGLALARNCYPGQDRDRPLHRHVRDLVRDLLEEAARRRPGGAAREVTVPDTWSEALRLCVVRCHPEDAGPVLEAILEPLDGEEGRRARAVLAAQCLADEPDVSDEQAARVLERFVAEVGARDGQGEDTPTPADLAAQDLAHSEFREQMEDWLLAAFGREPPLVREAHGVLYALSAYEAAPTHSAGLGRWLDDRVAELASPHEVKRIRACLSIMEVGYQGRANLRPGVEPALLGLLGRGGAVSHAAAWALRYLRRAAPDRPVPWAPAPADLSRLCALLRDPGADAGAIIHVAELLRHCRSTEAVPDLLERIRLAIASPGTREEAKKVINAVGGALVAIGEPATEAVIALLRAEPGNWEVRNWAATILEHLDPDESRFSFSWAEYCRPDKPVPIRTKALRVLARKAGLHEEERRLLVSRDPNGKERWIDPVIDEMQVARIARALQLPAEEVRRRLEALARRLPLSLSWS